MGFEHQPGQLSSCALESYVPNHQHTRVPALFQAHGEHLTIRWDAASTDAWTISAQKPLGNLGAQSPAMQRRGCGPAWLSCSLSSDLAPDWARCHCPMHLVCLACLSLPSESILEGPVSCILLTSSSPYVLLEVWHEVATDQ